MSNGSKMREVIGCHLQPSFENYGEHVLLQKVLTEIDQTSIGLEQLICGMDILEHVQELKQQTNKSDEDWNHITMLSLESALPSEYFSQVSISNEGFSGTLNKIVEWIKRLTSAILNGLKKLAHFIVDDTTQLKFAIQNARIKVRTLEGSTYGPPTVKLGRLGSVLESSLGIPKDYRQLIRGVVELQHQMVLIEEHWVTPILRNADGLNIPLTHALQNNVSVHDLVALNARTLSVLNPDHLTSGFTRTSPVVDTKYGNGTARSGPPLMGNRSVVVSSPKDLKSTQNPVTHAELIQSISVTLTRLGSIDNLDVTELEMTTMSPTEMLELLRTVEEVLDYVSDNSVRDIVNRIDRIRSYVENKTPLAGNGEKTQRESRATLSYAAAYVRWLKDPYIPLLGLSDTTVRALLMLCNRHINAYR